MPKEDFYRKLIEGNSLDNFFDEKREEEKTIEDKPTESLKSLWHKSLLQVLSRDYSIKENSIESKGYYIGFEKEGLSIEFAHDHKRIVGRIHQAVDNWPIVLGAYRVSCILTLAKNFEDYLNDERDFTTYLKRKIPSCEFDENPLASFSKREAFPHTNFCFEDTGGLFGELKKVMELTDECSRVLKKRIIGKQFWLKDSTKALDMYSN